MFIGHFALGFAAKRAAPRVSLAVLFAAAQLADVMWPALLAVGVEQVRIVPHGGPFTQLEFIAYPYSHSLVMLAVWGVVFGALYLAWAGRRSGATSDRGAIFAVLVTLVVSHWVLDVVSHLPDMPLYPGGGPKLGLGLWKSIAGTIVVESLLFAGGVFVYARATRPRGGSGRWPLITLVALLAASYLASFTSDPPPSVTAVVVVGLVGAAILLALAWWADDRRRYTEPAVTPTLHSGAST